MTSHSNDCAYPQEECTCGEWEEGNSESYAHANPLPYPHPEDAEGADTNVGSDPAASLVKKHLKKRAELEAEEKDETCIKGDEGNREEQELLEAGKQLAEGAAIPMLLWCPMCHTRHIDEPDQPRHKSHACQRCGLVWRPCQLPTHGVEFLPGCQNESYSELDKE